MAAKFRSVSVHYKDKRQKYKTEGSLEYSTAAEAIVTEEGYVNHSQGPITSQAQFSIAVPVGGTGDGVEENMVEGAEVWASFFAVNGKIHTIRPMTVTQCSFSFDDKNQTQTRQVTLMGGKPKITG